MANWFGYYGEISCYYDPYGCYSYDEEGYGGFYYWDEWAEFIEDFEWCYYEAPYQCELPRPTA